MPAKSTTGTEASMDALSATIDKALDFPRVGIHVGAGPHVTMPLTWNGQGATPLGWTRRATTVWVTSATDCALPLPDEMAALLQGEPAQSRLTPQERATITAAIASRSQVNLEGRSPKVDAVTTVVVTAKEAQVKEPS